MTENPDQQVAFRVAQIYLVRAAMGYRVEPLSLPPQTPLKPQPIQLSIASTELEGVGGAATHIAVRVTTNPQDGDANALYDFAVDYAAIVRDVDKEKFPEDKLVRVVGAMLLPFVREAVANLTMRGRFGPVWLNPLSVQDLFRDREAESAAAAAQQGT